MGSGRMAILESIDRTGSINQTARELNMSYKTAWSKIKSTEKNLGKPLLLSDRKNGTRLTEEGRHLLARYRELKERCIQADNRIFEELFPSGE
jgi:molybdate transport system regulatory protein